MDSGAVDRGRGAAMFWSDGKLRLVSVDSAPSFLELTLIN